MVETDQNREHIVQEQLYRAMYELLDTENLPLERETHILLSLDTWLAEARGDEKLFKSRCLQVEKTWVILQKEKQAEDESSSVFSPQIERLLQNQIETMTNEDGASVLFYGIPGTGKSRIVKELAARVSKIRQNGVRRISGNPSGPSTELLSRPMVGKRELRVTHYLNLLENIQNRDGQAEDQLVQILDTILKSKIQQLSQGRVKPRAYLLRRELQKLGLKTEIIDTDKVEFTPALYKSIIEQNGGYDGTTSSLRFSLRQQETQETLSGLDRMEVGSLYDALVSGDTAVLDELDKLTGGGTQPMAGLEDVPDPDQKLVELLDSSVAKESGFSMIATANDIDVIPRNILRRFDLVHFMPGLSDLVWQARVMLSDEKGNSIIDQSEEHALCEFMLWWDALTVQKNVAFNINALSDICASMKNGLPFEKALNKFLVTQPTLKKSYSLYSKHRKRRVSSFTATILEQDLPEPSTQLLTLSELNWTSNKDSLGTGRELTASASTFSSSSNTSPSTFAVKQSSDKPNTLSITQRGDFNPVTGDYPEESRADIPLKISPDSQLKRVFSSELVQTAVVEIKTGDLSRLKVVDTPTGTEIVLTQYQEDKGKIVDAEFDTKNTELLATQFISENKGLILFTRSGITSLAYFTKEFVESPKNPLKTLVAQVSAEVDVTTDSITSAKVTQHAVLIRTAEKAFLTLIRPNQADIFETVELPHPAYELEETPTGTLIINTQIEPHKKRWLKI